MRRLIALNLTLAFLIAVLAATIFYVPQKYTIALPFEASVHFLLEGITLLIFF